MAQTTRGCAAPAHHRADHNDLASVDGLGPRLRRRVTRDGFSPVMMLVSLLALIGIVAYGAFLLNPANRGDLLPCCS